MDNVTHSLFALTIARTPIGGRRGRGTTVALVLASNAPDIDILATIGGATKYLEWHRGATHGLPGIIGLGLVTATLVWAGLRVLDARRHRNNASFPNNASFLTLAGVSILGVLLHVLMDLPTSYGTRLLSPFDWHWFTTDWMPIVDIYLIVALAAGLYFGRGSEAARRHNVAIVLVLMTVNYGVRATAHQQALRLAPRLFGPTLPAWCDGAAAQGSTLARWPRDPAPILPSPGQPRCLVEVAAMPSFLSPFEWRVIARMSNAYDLQDVNLLERRFLSAPREPEVLWRLASRYPNQWTDAAIDAASTPTGQVFLGFSRFPVARTLINRSGAATVQLSDVRFLTNGLRPTGPAGSPPRAPAPGLFTLTVRFDAEGRILDEGLGP